MAASINPTCFKISFGCGGRVGTLSFFLSFVFFLFFLYGIRVLSSFGVSGYALAWPVCVCYIGTYVSLLV